MEFRPILRANFVIKLTLLITLSNELITETQVASAVVANVSNPHPLIYTRLRFDHDFLQIYRRFQKHLQLDEKKVTIELARNDDGLNSSAPASAATQKLVYYENDQVESTNLTLDDLIFEALDRAYATRLIPAYIYNYDTKEDLAKASDSRLISKQRCRKELNYLVERLHALQEYRQTRTTIDLVNVGTHSPELLALFDSIAGEETGLLMGNYHWLGDWRQCSRRQIFELNRNKPANSISFNGRYCTASIRSQKWSGRIATRKRELIAANYFKYPEQQYDYERFFRIQLGVCLPESCDSQALSEHSNEIHRLATFKLSESFRSYELVDLFCLPDETSELRQVEFSGQLWICLAIGWCSLVLLATIADYIRSATGNNSESQPKPSSMAKLVSAMSLIRNFRRLIETDSLKTRHYLSLASNGGQQLKANITKRPATTETTTTTTAAVAKQPNNHDRVNLSPPPINKPLLAPDDLLFINAIKVFSMPLILFGHAGMLIKHLDRYVLDYDGLNSDFVFHFHASSVFYTDWFFVISGFLITYLMFVTRKVENNSTAQWLYTLFHRYWRLAPTYLLLFWFSKSVFIYTSRGPNWDYGTSNMTLRGICRRESWIYPLTLSSNLHPIHEECIMPAWYVACDMQFYMITPLLLILLRKSPLLGWLVSLGTIGACISLRLHRYLSDPKAQPLELMRPRYDVYMRNNWDMHATYVYPQYRIAPYLIGCLAGHYTYMVLSGNWRSPIYSIPNASMSRSSNNKASSNSSSSTSARLSSMRFWLRLATFLWGIQLLLSMMFGTWLIDNMFPIALERHVRYFTSLIYATHDSAAGLGMALFLTTIMLGQFQWLRSSMSHPNWTVLSRINFVAFLIQVELIYWLVQSADRTIEMSSLELIKLFCYLSCFTYLFAFVLTILLELPLAQLERQFIGVLFAGRGATKKAPN